jgi:hypothetical protein
MKDYFAIAASLLEYKKELSALLLSLDPEDIRRGKLVLDDQVLSEDFRGAVLSQSKGLLEDYQIRFHNGRIHVRVDALARQLGPLTLEYDINIQEFRFDPSGHKIFADFRESAVSNGNMAQKLAVKAALLNGPLLKTAAQFLKNLSFMWTEIIFWLIWTSCPCQQPFRKPWKSVTSAASTGN